MTGRNVLIFTNIEDVKGELNALTKNDDSFRAINLTFEWLSNWIKFYYKNLNLNYQEIFVVYYKGKQASAIVPLVVINKSYFGLKLKSVEFLGQQWGATYCDLIGHPINKDEWKSIVEYIKTKYHYDLLFLSHIPDFSQTFKDFSCLPYQVVPEIDLSEFADYEDYRKRIYSKNHKQNLRTAINRVKKDGLSYSVTHQKYGKSVYENILSISKSKLKDGKLDKYDNIHKKAFRQSLFNAFESNITFISLNDNGVAYRVNHIYGSTKLCFDASYDREYPKYNLGILSVDESIKDSFAKKLKFHCEGPGIDYYKTKFATKYVKLNYYIEKGNSFKSGFLFKLLKFVLTRKSKSFQHAYNKNLST